MHFSQACYFTHEFLHYFYINRHPKYNVFINKLVLPNSAAHFLERGTQFYTTFLTILELEGA